MAKKAAAPDIGARKDMTIAAETAEQARRDSGAILARIRSTRARVNQLGCKYEPRFIYPPHARTG